MKITLLSLLLIPTILLHAETTTPSIQEFSKEYWAAVKARNTEKALSYFDLRILEQLTPEEQKFVKEGWVKSLLQAADNQGDSQRTTTSEIPTTAELLPTWRWPAKPQYQIQVEMFKNVPTGKESHYSLIEVAFLQDGFFKIIRPIPPADQLEKQIKLQAH